MPWLTCDIVGEYSRILYGVEGTEVSVLYDHGNVKIVQAKEGAKFCCPSVHISDIPPSTQHVHEQPNENAVATSSNPSPFKRKHRKKSLNNEHSAQSNLF